MAATPDAVTVAAIAVTDAPFPAPLIYRRAVRFGDTDAARIAYTIRLFDYAMEALESWFNQVLTNSWYDLNLIHGVGSPFVHAELDMRATLRPGDEVDVTVMVADTGRSTLRFELKGVRTDGVDAFAGVWICAFIDVATEKSIPIPPALATRITLYRERCGAIL